MLVLHQYRQLQAAACLLWEKGVLQEFSHSSLVCYLALLAYHSTHADVNQMAERLNWSKKRTRRALQALANAEIDGHSLVRRIPGERQKSGRFTASRYHLVSPPKTSDATIVMQPTQDTATTTDRNCTIR